MLNIFSDLLEECMEVFMDDFTVYVDTFEACLGNLSHVLKRCMETNLVLNYEKCHFMVTKGIVLGHLVSNRGIEVEKAKIDVIASLPKPTLVRDVRSFLGHAGFCRRFIKTLARSPYLYTNCFKKITGKPVHVIAYASQTMDLAQMNYTTTEKELLAIAFALDKFRAYLLGSKVIVFSDHVALKYLLKKQDAK
ncbi:Retrovirus-related Pol polyprotein, partial [Mucuna pruriens]